MMIEKRLLGLSALTAACMALLVLVSAGCSGGVGDSPRTGSGIQGFKPSIRRLPTIHFTSIEGENVFRPDFLCSVPIAASSWDGRLITFAAQGNKSSREHSRPGSTFQIKDVYRISPALSQLRRSSPEGSIEGPIYMESWGSAIGDKAGRAPVLGASGNIERWEVYRMDVRYSMSGTLRAKVDADGRLAGVIEGEYLKARYYEGEKSPPDEESGGKVNWTVKGTVKLP